MRAVSMVTWLSVLSALERWSLAQSFRAAFRPSGAFMRTLSEADAHSPAACTRIASLDCPRRPWATIDRCRRSLATPAPAPRAPAVIAAVGTSERPPSVIGPVHSRQTSDAAWARAI